MKTTIEIPDALAADARRLARDEGSTLRDLVISGLRSEIERRRARGRVDFAFPTVAGNGLRADLSPAEIIDMSYGLPAGP